jgi:hypothetical protein
MDYIEIMFSDLTQEKQQQLLDLYEIGSPSQMNWDIIPVFVIQAPEADQSPLEDPPENRL